MALVHTHDPPEAPLTSTAVGQGRYNHHVSETVTGQDVVVRLELDYDGPTPSSAQTSIWVTYPAASRYCLWGLRSTPLSDLVLVGAGAAAVAADFADLVACAFLEVVMMRKGAMWWIPALGRSWNQYLIVQGHVDPAWLHVSSTDTSRCLFHVFYGASYIHTIWLVLGLETRH
jgi:hypothetical protein